MLKNWVSLQERGHQETSANSEGAPSYRGSDWSAYNQLVRCLTCHSFMGEWQRGGDLTNFHDISATVCQKACVKLWSQLEEDSVVWWDYNWDVNPSYSHKHTVASLEWQCNMVVAAWCYGDTSLQWDIHFISGKMNTEKCREILVKHMMQSAKKKTATWDKTKHEAKATQLKTTTLMCEWVSSPKNAAMY